MDNPNCQRLYLGEGKVSLISRVDLTAEPVDQGKRKSKSIWCFNGFQVGSEKILSGETWIVWWRRRSATARVEKERRRRKDEKRIEKKIK